MTLRQRRRCEQRGPIARQLPAAFEAEIGENFARHARANGNESGMGAATKGGAHPKASHLSGNSLKHGVILHLGVVT